MPPRSQSERSLTSVTSWGDDSFGIEGIDDVPVQLPTSGCHKKSVRFSSELFKTIMIPSLDDIPEEEVAAAWYNADEYAKIQSEYKMTILLMETGGIPVIKNKEGQTSRGLESRTRDGAWARYNTRRDAANAVLDEQDRQWELEADDPDKIAEIYTKKTAKSRDDALRRAKQDQSDALTIGQPSFILLGKRLV